MENFNLKKQSILVLGQNNSGKTTIISRLKNLLGENEYIINDPAGFQNYLSLPISLLRSEIIIIVYDMSYEKSQNEKILENYLKVQNFDNIIILLGNKKDIERNSIKNKLHDLISFSFYDEICAKGENSEFSNIINFIRNQEKKKLENKILIERVREKTYQYYLCGGDCGIPGDTYKYKYKKTKKFPG